MGHWNYRVVLREYDDGRDARYGIHEAYYDDEVRVESVTDEPVPVYAESLDKLRDELDWMLRALEAPVLGHGDFAPGAVPAKDHARSDDTGAADGQA
jgi:hypothetical protein